MVSAYVISICFLKVGNTIQMSEIIFSYSSEKRERKNTQTSGLGCLRFLFKIVF